MIKDNILYHNVDEIEETRFGDRLHRYTKDVSSQLINERAKEMNRYTCGCELRFVTDAKNIRITLYSEDPYGTILVYKGDNMHSSYQITTVGFMSFTLTDVAVYNEVSEDFFRNRRFAKDVWRVYFHGFRCAVSEIDTMGHVIRPPKESEMPRKILLSYGSSISHGASTLVHTNVYPQVFARLAGMDCLIKGTGGSCHIERPVAHNLFTRGDWDVALLELGINMVGDFEPEIFEERFHYIVDQMVKTGKRLILLTIFPCGEMYKSSGNVAKLEEFNDIIRTKYAALDKKQCLLVEGSDVLTETSYLTCDCIHPSTEGHFMMGIHLYQKVKEAGFLEI